MKVLWLSELSDPGVRGAVAGVVDVVRGSLSVLDEDEGWLASIAHLFVEVEPGYRSAQWMNFLLDESGRRFGHFDRNDEDLSRRLPGAVERLWSFTGRFSHVLVVITRDDAGLAVVEDHAMDKFEFFKPGNAQGLARELLPAGLASRVGDGYPGKEREEWLASREPPRVRDDLSVADHALIEECLGVVLDAELLKSDDPVAAAAVAGSGWHTAGIGVEVRWDPDDDGVVGQVVPAMVVLYGPGSEWQGLDFDLVTDMIYREREAVQVWGNLALNQYGERFTDLKIAVYRGSWSADVEYGWDKLEASRFNRFRAFDEYREAEIPSIVFPAGGPETVGRYRVSPPSV